MDQGDLLAPLQIFGVRVGSVHACNRYHFSLTETVVALQVHVSTLDFGLLTAAAPFWISNDAQRRQWKGR